MVSLTVLLAVSVSSFAGIAAAAPTTGAGATTGAGSATTADHFEPNNDFAHATTLTPGVLSTYRNLNVGPGDVDVYGVQLQSGERLVAMVAHRDGGLQLSIYGPDQQSLNVNRSSNYLQAANVVANRTGTYYVVVSRTGAATDGQNASLPYALVLSKTRSTLSRGGSAGNATGTSTGTTSS